MILSQKLPGAPVPAPAEPMPWDQDRRDVERRHRSHSPFRAGIGPLGGSIACSGAAQQDDGLPGRGLYVSMQKGGLPNFEGGSAIPRTPSPRTRGTRRSSRAALTARQPTGNGNKMGLQRACNYEAFFEDPIDRAVELHARRLPHESGRALFIRKIATGHYEVDNVGISISMRGPEAYVHPVKGDENAWTERLSSYLHHAGEVAAQRGSFTVMNSNGQSFNQSFNQSFDQREAMSNGSGRYPLVQMHNWAAPGMAVLSGESSSFYLPSREGSFYGAAGPVLRTGGGSNGGSFYMRQDPLVTTMAARSQVISSCAGVYQRN